MLADIAESPRLNHRRDASFYLVLFFFVGPIWSVVPASWAYLLYTVYYWNSIVYTRNSLVLLVLAVCEVSGAL